MTKAQTKKIKQIKPLLSAIRKRCLDCSADNPHEVKLCPCFDCPLYNYRFGSLKIPSTILHKDLKKNTQKQMHLEGTT